MKRTFCWQHTKFNFKHNNNLITTTSRCFENIHFTKQPPSDVPIIRHFKTRRCDINMDEEELIEDRELETRRVDTISLVRKNKEK